MFGSEARETRVTVCLVHGNPETAAVWDRLAPLLDRGPVVRLSPPGFGAPVPPRFTATVEEYRRWLVAELERFERPVYLVGHDWGGAHVMNVVMTRPELVRSWVCDVIGLFDQDYQWHDRVQVWATPGAGEEAIAAMIDPPVTERAAALVKKGMQRRRCATGRRGAERRYGRLHPPPVSQRCSTDHGPARPQSRARRRTARPVDSGRRRPLRPR